MSYSEILILKGDRENSLNPAAKDSLIDDPHNAHLSCYIKLFPKKLQDLRKSG